jgi:hypothetical protein
MQSGCSIDPAPVASWLGALSAGHFEPPLCEHVVIE